MAEVRPGATGDGATGDGATLARAGADLAEAVDDAVGPWLRRVVVERLGAVPTPEVEASIDRAVAEARATVVPRLAELLALDLDQQWTNPLALVRTLVPYATTVLADAGVAPVDRDDDARRLQPDDVYGLTPATFADLGPEVHEPGLLWGAAKAHLHLQRRKARETA